MPDRRPDPDELLVRVREQEARRTRGKLKVFFGAAAGVGKTYAMLEAARAQRAAGVDVVAGVVETHHRAETEALLAGVEILPRRRIEYRGSTLEEFDLDAALARRPGVLLVDELAHTNAPETRHPKRYQDVLELLEAGITVYTTLNVQHLESLNDVVAKITGVVVRETVPDSVFEQADEVELLDLPAEDLRQRLREGKVYVPEQAAEAARHFFREGNLIALRELALRRTADRVDAQMQRYRRDHAIQTTWPVAERILVCVGPSPFSAQLVRAGRRLATRLGAEWMVAYIETPGGALGDGPALRAVERHHGVPAGRRRRVDADAARRLGPGVHPQRGGLRLLLRAPVFHVRGGRFPVPPDVRGHARGGAGRQRAHGAGPRPGGGCRRPRAADLGRVRDEPRAGRHPRDPATARRVPPAPGRGVRGADRASAPRRHRRAGAAGVDARPLLPGSERQGRRPVGD